MKNFGIGLIAITALSITSAIQAQQPKWSDYYSFEKIALPEKVDHQLGGLTTLSDGRIAACFNSGEVQIYNPKDQKWAEFAHGLMTPLGILEEPSGALLVMQWTELTRLTDTDSDGKADFYETVFDGFGVTGNYHEFAYGPARDSEGNLYIALNVASNNGGVFKHVRGPWSPIGLDKEHMDVDNGKSIADEFKREAGRMYSRVPYRGWVIKIAPDGKAEPFANGFRSPDGIAIDENDNLWVTDNQGDWKATSPLYHVQKGGFYGHPASLTWKEGWTRNPLDVPVDELQAMRTREAALFPYGDMANSPTQPIPTINPEKFGLPKGELLIGDMNQPNLIRYVGEEVGGVRQGAAIPFLLTPDLGIGNHRFAFTPDGDLLIGKMHQKWAGDEGLLKVVWNHKSIFLVEKVHLLENGFEISFNHPLGDILPNWKLSRHTYTYHGEYGSPKVDEQDVEATEVTVSDDRKTIRLTLPEIKADYLYNITAMRASDSEGRPLMGNTMHYFVNTVAPTETAFNDLLDTGDLSNFFTGSKGKKKWVLKDGVVSRGEEKTGGFMTRKKYKNFELKFDWKISEGGNSGVIYRASKGKGLEYQVLDDERHIRGKTSNSSAAALYDLVGPAADKPYKVAGEWNSGRIVCDGNHIEHWLNGMKVLEIEMGSDDWNGRFEQSKFKDAENFAGSENNIQFQDHGADVSYRNILIREL